MVSFRGVQGGASVLLEDSVVLLGYLKRNVFPFVPIFSISSLKSF